MRLYEIIRKILFYEDRKKVLYRYVWFQMGRLLLENLEMGSSPMGNRR
jgi:hypothetical protein